MGPHYRKHGSVKEAQSLCHHVDWSTVRDSLKSHPISTEQNTRHSLEPDPMGRVFMSDLVGKNAPVDVIEQALQVFPDALTLNLSCFFAACRHESTDVLRIITKHFLSKSLKDSDKSPFPWIVLGHVNARGARVLLEECPHGALQDASSGLCPLDRLLFSGTSTSSHECDLLEKIKLMLMVEEHGTVKLESQQTYHPVHGILRRVIHNRPSFFSDRKEAQQVVGLLHKLHLVEPQAFKLRDKNGDFPLHVILRGKCAIGSCAGVARELIKMLVRVCPASARVAALDGRLPMHLALENGWPCHDLLLQAAPQALQTRDMQTGMYPFQTAACSKVAGKKRTRGQINSLDVTYMLLRENPVQARGLLEGTTN